MIIPYHSLLQLVSGGHWVDYLKKGKESQGSQDIPLAGPRNAQ
jgi:hypothetical protein